MSRRPRATSAPALANAIAIDRPSPRAAPVTIAIRPFKSNLGTSFRFADIEVIVHDALPQNVVVLTAVCVLTASVPVSAQISTTLKPETVAAFDRYAADVETQLEQTWHHGGAFTAIETDPAALKSVMSGQISIHADNPDNPAQIPNGLIHDWIGDVFIPNTTADAVLSVMRDFDHHAGLYRDITRSKTLQNGEAHVVGYWRVDKKDQIMRVVLDIVDEAYYQKIGPGKWICRAYAKNIRQVQHAGERDESVLPQGQGNGFLWRLYAYWSLKETQGGVLAECRTLSLSRDIPLGLGWTVKPFIRSQPRQSLISTLQSTREASTNVRASLSR
jgi:hypothetical protein